MVGWGTLQAIVPFIRASNDSSIDEEGDVSRSILRVDKDPIARGGFCDLYLGQHRTHGKVALRRPRSISSDPAIIRRFHREVKLLTQVEHKHILPFLGTCMVGPDFYMVSPYMKNGDLKQWMDKGYKMDSAEILRQIGGAIAHLHMLNIVHGDIKAQNVLLADDETAQLCDFGLAKALDTMDGTSTGAKGRGSARWMAPELFENNPKTKESDVYAFGMTIVEVLTRKPPFKGIYDYAIVNHVLNLSARPDRPESFEEPGSSELWDAAEKCWAKDPGERPHASHIFGIPDKVDKSALEDSLESQPTTPTDAKFGGTPNMAIPRVVIPDDGFQRHINNASPVDWVVVERSQTPILGGNR